MSGEIKIGKTNINTTEYEAEKSRVIGVRTDQLYNRHFTKFQIAGFLLMPLIPFVYAAYWGVMRCMAKSDFKHALAQKRMELIKNKTFAVLHYNYIKEKNKFPFSGQKVQQAAEHKYSGDALEQWREIKKKVKGPTFLDKCLASISASICQIRDIGAGPVVRK